MWQWAPFSMMVAMHFPRFDCNVFTYCILPGNWGRSHVLLHAVTILPFKLGATTNSFTLSFLVSRQQLGKTRMPTDSDDCSLSAYQHWYRGNYVAGWTSAPRSEQLPLKWLNCAASAFLFLQSDSTVENKPVGWLGTMCLLMFKRHAQQHMLNKRPAIMRPDNITGTFSLKWINDSQRCFAVRSLATLAWNTSGQIIRTIEYLPTA